MQLLFFQLIRIGNTGQQTDRIRMLRMFKDFKYRPGFNDFSTVHNRDTITDTCHNTKIMRNHDNTGINFLLQMGNQFQNLCLYGHIQRRCRLIRDNDFRITGECDCNDDTLPHATGKLMRILSYSGFRRRNANLSHQFDCALFRFFL